MHNPSHSGLLDMDKARVEQRLRIVGGILWGHYGVPLNNVRSTVMWLHPELREYYRGLTDWVEEYENS